VIVSKEYNGEVPMCLILSGDVGIGKTHLAVSVADEVTQKGLTALFVDAHSITRVFQKRLCFTTFLDELVKDIDLVILDNINDRYGIEQETYNHFIDYITKNKKALMITTNNIKSLELDKLMGYYPDFSDELVYDYVIMDGLSGDSYRRPKPVTVIDITLKNENDEYDFLLIEEAINSTDNTIVLIDSNLHEFNRQEKLAQLEKIYKDYDILDSSVFTTEIPAYYRKVCDMYMYELDDDTEKSFDVVVTCMYDQMGAEQVRNLLPIAHNQDLRIIILVDDIKNFKQLMAKEFKDHVDCERYDNMLERYNTMFGPAFSFD